LALFSVRQSIIIAIPGGMMYSSTIDSKTLPDSEECCPRAIAASIADFGQLAFLAFVTANARRLLELRSGP
jgi:hypothetical protein